MLVKRYDNPDINPTVLAAYSVPQGYMVLANAYGEDVRGFDIWIFSHTTITLERLRLSPVYTTEQSLILAAERLAKILGATPLPLD
jgi:hypothetical protein